MCLSELGDLAEASTKAKQASTNAEWLDGQDEEISQRLDAALELLLQRLKEHTSHATGPGAAAGRLDRTLLGSGLRTSWQLQLPAAENHKTRKVLQRHSRMMQDMLLNEGRAATEAVLHRAAPQMPPTDAAVILSNLIQVALPYTPSLYLAFGVHQSLQSPLCCTH